MSMEPRIRPYRPGDETAVAQVASECFDRFIRPFYSEQGVRSFSAYIDPEAVARRQSIDCLMFVADLEGELVGLIEMRGFDHISMLFVKPEFQKRGIATQLFDRALRTALKLEPGLDELTVFSAPGVEQIYRHWGFVEIGPETEADGIRFLPMRLPL